MEQWDEPERGIRFSNLSFLYILFTYCGKFLQEWKELVIFLDSKIENFATGPFATKRHDIYRKRIPENAREKERGVIHIYVHIVIIYLYTQTTREDAIGKIQEKAKKKGKTI